MSSKNCGITLKSNPRSMAQRDFTTFAAEAEPRLRRALLGAVGIERMPDAVAEALAYAWQHWHDVQAMANPVGYLYRVGQSRARVRKRPRLFKDPPQELPHIEPGLTNALLGLPQRQRTAVWLAYGCEWTRAEIGEALGISASTVGNHLERGLRALRQEMGVVNEQ